VEKIMSSRKRLKPKAEELDNSLRSCEGCNACCVVLRIKELEKAPGIPCEHLAGKRCGIYLDRPTVCRDYRCPWLQGVLPDWMKPAKCGVLVQPQPKKEDCCEVHELWPNAGKSRSVAQWIKSQVDRGVEVVLFPYSEPHAPLPDAQVIKLRGSVVKELIMAQQK